MKIKKIECFKVNLHLKKKFVISHSTRSFSESVFVKIELENGILGWGESLPRNYVTGETQESVIKVIEKKFVPLTKKIFPNSYAQLIKNLQNIRVRKNENCALCAFEIALLDAYGKYFKKSVSYIFGKKKKSRVTYSGAVSGDEGIELRKKLYMIKLFGLKRIKVKVGVGDDLKRLKTVRNVLGNKVDIRIDANCAWTVKQTLNMIEKLKVIGLNGIEQPVKTIKEINQITKQTNLPVIVDESLCSIDDAKRLKNVIYDIRISKCGGLLKSYEIYKFAEKNRRKMQVSSQLGCQVGESGILSAAGRHFAFGVKYIEYLEGSYNNFLLKQDITKEDLTFGMRGYGKPVSGYGLGVEVDEGRLKKFMID